MQTGTPLCVTGGFSSRRNRAASRGTPGASRCSCRHRRAQAVHARGAVPRTPTQICVSLLAGGSLLRHCIVPTHPEITRKANISTVQLLLSGNDWGFARHTPSLSLATVMPALVRRNLHHAIQPRGARYDWNHPIGDNRRASSRSAAGAPFRINIFVHHCGGAVERGPLGRPRSNADRSSLQANMVRTTPAAHDRACSRWIVREPSCTTPTRMARNTSPSPRPRIVTR